METELLNFANQVAAATGGFKPAIWYNRDLDRLEYFIENRTGVTNRIDEVLTIVRDGDNGRPIGFYLKGVRSIYRHLYGLGLAEDDGFIEAVEVIKTLTGALIREREGNTAEGIDTMYRAYREALAVAQHDVARINFHDLIEGLDDNSTSPGGARRSREA